MCASLKYKPPPPKKPLDQQNHIQLPTKITNMQPADRKLYKFLGTIVTGNSQDSNKF